MYPFGLHLYLIVVASASVIETEVVAEATCNWFFVRASFKLDRPVCNGLSCLWHEIDEVQLLAIWVCGTVLSIHGHPHLEGVVELIDLEALASSKAVLLQDPKFCITDHLEMFRHSKANADLEVGFLSHLVVCFLWPWALWQWWVIIVQARFFQQRLHGPNTDRSNGSVASEMSASV